MLLGTRVEDNAKMMMCSELVLCHCLMMFVVELGQVMCRNVCQRYNLVCWSMKLERIRKGNGAGGGGVKVSK